MKQLEISKLFSMKWATILFLIQSLNYIKMNINYMLIIFSSVIFNCQLVMSYIADELYWTMHWFEIANGKVGPGFWLISWFESMLINSVVLWYVTFENIGFLGPFSPPTIQRVLWFRTMLLAKSLGSVMLITMALFCLSISKQSSFIWSLKFSRIFFYICNLSYILQHKKSTL